MVERIEREPMYESRRTTRIWSEDVPTKASCIMEMTNMDFMLPNALFQSYQLTFNKEGVYTVIPVVSDPIDAVGGITPPVDLPGELEWWQVVFSLVMMVLLVLLLAPLWPYIIRAILWVFDYVGMGVRAVARLIRERRNSRREE